MDKKIQSTFNRLPELPHKIESRKAVIAHGKYEAYQTLIRNDIEFPKHIEKREVARKVSEKMSQRMTVVEQVTPPKELVIESAPSNLPETSFQETVYSKEQEWEEQKQQNDLQNVRAKVKDAFVNPALEQTSINPSLDVVTNSTPIDLNQPADNVISLDAYRRQPPQENTDANTA